MQPRGKVSRVDVFTALAQRQVERILQDACLLVVPTRQVDAAASRRRREELEEVGLTLLNLAAFFVPGVGELLLAKMLQETLSQVYEGVADWSKGRDHEALEHLLNVAQTVVGNTLVAGGAVAARRFVGSAFVDGLKPVTVMPGKERLWSDDLQPYRTAGLPGSATLTELGLYGDGQRHWWRNADDYYEVHQARPAANWSLRHPGNDAAYGPGWSATANVPGVLLMMSLRRGAAAGACWGRCGQGRRPVRQRGSRRSSKSPASTRTVCVDCWWKTVRCPSPCATPLNGSR
jgi:hypothetical protein